MVNYYIFCHACHVPFRSDYSNRNLNLYFDTTLNSASCSTEPQLEFDADAFPYKENYFHQSQDYILSFKDNTYSSSNTSLQLFGLFDEQQRRIEIANVTNGMFNDILLSDLLKFIIAKNERSNVFCSFCRNACESYVSLPATPHLEYGKEESSYELDDIDFHSFSDDDMDFANTFNGGKRTRQRRQRKRQRSQRRQRKRQHTVTFNKRSQSNALTKGKTRKPIKKRKTRNAKQYNNINKTI